MPEAIEFRRHEANTTAPSPAGIIAFIRRNLPALLVILSLTTLAAVLSWNAKKDMDDFRAYQQEIVEQSVDGAGNEIVMLIETLRASLGLMVDERQDSLRRLARNPKNEQSGAHIFKKVAKYFPNFFAFTIADERGDVFYDDLSGKVSDTCRQDIKKFATSGQQPEIYIHPGPAEYDFMPDHHVDVMLPWNYGGDKEGVFFASFTPTLFSRLLRDSQAPGHELMLLLNEDKGLVEVTAEGSRDLMEREIHLSPEEIKRITYSKPVKYTRWRLVDLPSEQLFTAHASQILTQAIAVFIGFTLASVVLLLLIKREERRRTAAEQIVKDQLQEREQIVRDLHDDVGAKLLTLAHQCEKSKDANKARSALQTLREIINRLGSPRTAAALDDAVADWRAEVRDRLDAAKIELKWDQHTELPRVMLDPRQRIGLTGILREAVSNAIHHAQPSTIQVKVDADAHRLTLRVCDDGPPSDTGQWSPNTGLVNMRRRAAELDGSIRWRPNAAAIAGSGGPATGTCVEVECPLAEEN